MKTNLFKHMLLCGVAATTLGLLLGAAPAEAGPCTTNPCTLVASTTSGGVNLQAKAVFTLSGSDLSIQLFNISADPTPSNTQVLTAVFFDIDGLPTTVTAPANGAKGGGTNPNDTVITDFTTTTDIAGKAINGWAYKFDSSGFGTTTAATHYGISAVGFGSFGPGDKINPSSPTNLGSNCLTNGGSVDGVHCGIVSSSTTGGPQTVPFVQSSSVSIPGMVFTLTGVPSDVMARLNNIVFQYGSNFSEPATPPAQVPTLSCAVKALNPAENGYKGVDITFTGTPAGSTFSTTPTIKLLSGAGTCSIQTPVGNSVANSSIIGTSATGQCDPIDNNGTTSTVTCHFRKDISNISCNALATGTYGATATASCDPITTTLQLDTGRRVTQIIPGVNQADKYLLISKGDPGLNHVEILVNRVSYKNVGLGNGVNVIELPLLPDDTTTDPKNPIGVNEITLVGYGQPGDSADICMGDSPDSCSPPKAGKHLKGQGEDAWGRVIDNHEDNGQ